MSCDIKPVYGLFNFGEERETAKGSFEYIAKDISDIEKNFLRLGFHLYEFKNFEYYKDFGYDNFQEFCLKNFKLEKSGISRHINVWLNFAAEQNGSRKMWLDDRFSEYSYSQLVAMLPLKEEERKKIKPEMTIKEINKFKKNKKSSKVATSQPEKKKNYKECDAFKGKGNCEGCFYLEDGNCPYDRVGYFNDVVVAESEYKEIIEKKEQDILPDLKNAQEREDFVLSYKEWKIWCKNDLTEETFYRFDLPDQSAIVIRSFPQYLPWKKEEIEGKQLYLLIPEYKHFRDCETNMTNLKEHLKKLRKKE